MVDDGMQSEGGMFDIGIRLHVIQQVEPEFIQPQVHDGDTRRHLLDVDHLRLQSFELFASVFQVALLLG